MERRRWLSEQAYADLVALCQFLPGPASSQVGFAVLLVGLPLLAWASPSVTLAVMDAFPWPEIRLTERPVGMHAMVMLDFLQSHRIGSGHRWILPLIKEIP